MGLAHWAATPSSAARALHHWLQIFLSTDYVFPAISENEEHTDEHRLVVAMLGGAVIGSRMAGYSLSTWAWDPNLNQTSRSPERPMK